METQQQMDIQYMRRALQLAELGGVSVAPNPKVGAVIVFEEKIIGEGYHQIYGEAHAEVNALNAVKNKEVLSQSTIYVTLEPCSHSGKTPPCADMLVKHHFQRVVIACLDPNSKVSGKGVQRLKEAGITVEIGILEEEARWINRRFLTFHEKKRPYIFLKWAETRDGFIDRLPENRQKGVNWITAPHTKLFVHKWRSEEQSIMVGWKTINNDNPQLTVRKMVAPSPLRLVIDPNGKANRLSRVFTDSKPTVVFTKKEKIDFISETTEIVQLTEINASSILQFLYKRNIISVFIEGGRQTLQHFIDEQLWDEAFQLIGTTFFTEGVLAPNLINKTLLTSEKLEEDLLLHYKKR